MYKPGECGNPNGRPKKGTCLTDLMLKYLKKSIDVKTEDGEIKKIKYRDLFTQKVLKLAMEGDTVCLKLIWNYIDGMPKQKIEMEAEVKSSPLAEEIKKSREVYAENNNNSDTPNA